ncbi:MAG: DUF2608 domain-containing protein [Parachlamydiaceae bacterium]
MKNSLIIRVCAFYLMAAFSPVAAEIIEVSNFRQILDYVDQDTLLILDIDDTLLIPVQTLGTDVWFISRLERHRQVEQDHTSALDRALAEWEAVRHLTKVKLVEEGSDQIVDMLQKMNTVVIGLTTQGLALATRTVNQLKALGINLSMTAPTAHDHYFMNGTTGVLFRHGILFTSGSSKGEALIKLLNVIDFHPKSVVFINDKKTHLDDLERGVAREGIPFIGLRYSYSDSRVAVFDEGIATIQWAHSTFGSILSDEEAALILNR